MAHTISRSLAVFLSLTAAGCSQNNEKLISVDNPTVIGVPQIRYTFADPSSIRKNGSHAIINTRMVFDSQGVEALKSKMKSNRATYGVSPVAKINSSTEFNCDTGDFKVLASQILLANGHSEMGRLETGRVLPNSPIEQLMEYACMSALWRPFSDFVN